MRNAFLYLRFGFFLGMTLLATVAWVCFLVGYVPIGVPLTLNVFQLIFGLMIRFDEISKFFENFYKFLDSF